MRALPIPLLLLVITGCASSPAGRVRFANRPPVWRVNDRKPIAKPAEPSYAKFLYFNDAYLLRRLPRLLEVRGHRRALGVNSLGEVPDSTWFQNRIGVREMTVQEVRRGPSRDDSPEHHRPWIITGTKVGGASAGFIIKDQRGIKHLLKFDEKANPEMETAADVIVQRILHACGYNVPEDNIVFFRKSDLIMARDAVVKDTFGNKRPMTRKDLEQNLARIYIEKDGRIRGLTSKFLPGVPIGGIAIEGTRTDDPNDVFPHELRRDLRGLSVIFAWLNHNDVKEANTLDVWVTDPGDPTIHYVQHYQLDFGMALGVTGYTQKLRQVGYAHSVDLKYLLLTLPTFGVWTRPWEGIEQPDIPAIGLFTAHGYDPGLYAPSFPYYPVDESDRFDAFWGAKTLIRFTPAQIRAVVEEARYSDPRSAEYMIRVLIRRQRITARHWFNRVNPLDAFAIVGDARSHRLCFDDLIIKHELEHVASSTRYEVASYDFNGSPTGWSATVRPGGGGRACVDAWSLPRPEEGYVIYSITTKRGNKTLAPVQVHAALDPETGRPRVIGLRRH